jgi:hypothetical protein
MSKKIRLTESQLTNVIKRIISEMDGPSSKDELMAELERTENELESVLQEALDFVESYLEERVEYDTREIMRGLKEIINNEEGDILDMAKDYYTEIKELKNEIQALEFELGED